MLPVCLCMCLMAFRVSREIHQLQRDISHQEHIHACLQILHKVLMFLSSFSLSLTYPFPLTPSPFFRSSPRCGFHPASLEAKPYPGLATRSTWRRPSGLATGNREEQSEHHRSVLMPRYFFFFFYNWEALLVGESEQNGVIIIAIELKQL